MTGKTKKMIISSFLELVNSNEQYDKITVTDLVEKCGISRQTFYYHFEDVDKLVSWLFKRQTETVCNDFATYKDCAKSARMTAEFIEKYSKVITKAMTTSKCILAFNDLYAMFYAITRAYVENTLQMPKNYEPLVKFWANSTTGATINELQLEPEKRDFEKLYKQIFSYLPKGKSYQQ